METSNQKPESIVKDCIDLPEHWAPQVLVAAGEAPDICSNRMENN
jgi:hypothetical protein